MPKPGVTDPEAESARALLFDLGYPVTNVRTIRTYRIEGPIEVLPRLIERVLSNDAVELAVIGALPFCEVGQGQPLSVPSCRWYLIRDLEDQALVQLSREGQLSLSLAEMKAIQRHFADLGRNPTDCELETLAQTWSEHCSHKTLRGRITFEGQTFDNLLKQTIFRSTHELAFDWLVSVFSDNAGVVRFDDEHDVCFKVETHNHPSAIDPYGGANTGLGGVIRDALGTGLGAKPICNTDVFCVASPDPGHGALAGRRASTRSGCSRGSSPECAITATAWAFPRLTAPWPSTRVISPTHWYSAEPWACCRGECQSRRSSQTTGSSRSAAALAGTEIHGRYLQLDRAHRLQSESLPRAGPSRSATRSSKR